MKRRHYVIPVLMLMAGAAWGDEYGTLNAPNSVAPLYGPYGNPYSPDALNARMETATPIVRPTTRALLLNSNPLTAWRG